MGKLRKNHRIKRIKRPDGKQQSGRAPKIDINTLSVSNCLITALGLRNAKRIPISF